MAKVITPRSNIVRSFNPSQPPRPPISMAPAAPSGTGHFERVLLLEDEAQTNFILREYLESLGYQVVAVANGVDGLKEVIKTDFELVICDMMMPKLPGDMFYLAVQKTRPALCNRFVFITGHQENPAVDAFIERTHSAILVKPFRLQQLEATLEGILSRFPKKVRPLESAPAASTSSATPPTDLRLETRPEDRDRSSYQVPISMVSAKPVQSMVGKIVGLIRGNSQSTPSATTPSAPEQPPKITLRVPPDGRKITRRIAHLANAPIVPPPSGSISMVNNSGAASQATSPKPAGPTVPRVSRRLTVAKDETQDVSKATPKVTRPVPKAENIIRVKHEATASKPEAVKARVTRKVPSAAPAPAPKVTRSIPKVTVRVPKTTVKIAPPSSLIASKVSQKVTQKVQPKVTARVQPKVTAKVTAAIVPKVSRKIKETAPAPVVTRRVANAKKTH